MYVECIIVTFIIFMYIALNASKIKKNNLAKNAGNSDMARMSYIVCCKMYKCYVMYVCNYMYMVKTKKEKRAFGRSHTPLPIVREAKLRYDG